MAAGQPSTHYKQISGDRRSALRLCARTTHSRICPPLAHPVLLATRREQERGFCSLGKSKTPSRNGAKITTDIDILLAHPLSQRQSSQHEHQGRHKPFFP